MVVPRLRQIQRLPSKDGDHTSISSPADVLFRDQMTWNAWHKLATPPPSIANRSSCCPQSVVRLSNRRSSIESRPAELLAIVLNDSALEKSDIISFGMTSETLWQHALQRTRKESLLARTTPWAGAELACTGTYLTDLPRSFAKDDLAESTVQLPYKSPYMPLARKINWAAISGYDAPSEDPGIVWQSAFEALRGSTTYVPEARLKQMSDDLRSATTSFCSEALDAPWILRNLSTKEYVRCRPRGCSGGTRGYVDHPEGGSLCLDDVLLMRICWTRDVAWNEKDDVIVSRRGTWAGHCFDIVAFDGEETLSVGNGEWVDATDGVVEEARKLRARLGWGMRLRAR